MSQITHRPSPRGNRFRNRKSDTAHHSPLTGLLLFLLLVFLPGLLGAEQLTLEQSVEIALRRNRDLLTARQQVAEKKALLLYRRSQRLPQVTAEASYQEDYYSAQDSSAAQRAAYLVGSQELFRYGETPPGLLQAQQQYRQARFAYQKTVLATVSQVRRAFLSVLLTKEEIAERGKLLEELEKKHWRMKQRLEAGKVKPIDVKEALLEVEDEQLRINTLRRRLLTQKLELLSTIGMLENWLPHQVEVVGAIPEEFKGVSEDSLAAMVQKAWHRRPEVAEMEAQLEEQRRLVRQTYCRWLPSLTGGATYQYKTTQLGLDLVQTGNLWRTLLSFDHPLYQRPSLSASQDGDWSIRLGLSIPIFRGGESWGRLQQQKARLRQLEYELKDQQNRIELEIRKAFFDLMDAKERLELQRERVEITKQRLQIVESLIEFEWARYLTYEDILRRRQDFHQAQQDYFTFRRQYVMAAEDLRKALGER